MPEHVHSEHGGTDRPADPTTAEGPDRRGATDPAADGTDRVLVVGRSSWRFDVGALAALADATRECAVVCATGDRTTATWTGVSVPSLLERVDAPADTTHLVVEGSDGYRMTVPVADALSGLLAVERDGRPLAVDRPYATRFLAPGIDGERTVKGVARVEAVSLGPDEDPEALEELALDAERL